MERIALTVEKREVGKGVSKKYRVAQKIPAVLYGRAVEPIAVAVDRKAMQNALKTKAGMNVILDLSVAGGDSGLALVRDYQADPIKRDITHVDFQAIRMTDKLEVEVPIVLLGSPLGVKEGGIVEQARRTLHVRALPTNIPDKFEIDISGLNIGDNVHADDIKLPDGVEFRHTANFTLVSVVPPAKEEVAAPTVAAEGAVAAGAVPAAGQTPAVDAKAPAADAKAEKK